MDDRTPIIHDSTEVWRQGDALDPIWWRGRQWAVTAYGLECLDGTYVIERNRLVERIRLHGWPAHMAAKIWTDNADFSTAWLIAIALHGAKADPDDIRVALERVKTVEERQAKWQRDHPNGWEWWQAALLGQPEQR